MNDVSIFSHPDFTVGTGITPVQLISPLARGLYHRSGITPCPEDFYFINLIIKHYQKIVKLLQNQNFNLF